MAFLPRWDFPHQFRKLRLLRHDRRAGRFGAFGLAGFSWLLSRSGARSVSNYSRRPQCLKASGRRRHWPGDQRPMPATLGEAGDVARGTGKCGRCRSQVWGLPRRSLGLGRLEPPRSHGQCQAVAVGQPLRWNTSSLENESSCGLHMVRPIRALRLGTYPEAEEFITKLT